MTTVYLALGSNLGNRLENLRFATEKLAQNGVQIEAKSKIYAAQSVEGGGDGDFYNAAVRARTDWSVFDLLQICAAIERELGREKSAPGTHRGGARALDIDILLFGDETLALPELQIPHPRALRRAFVLRPLLDVLEGGWIKETAEIF